MTQARRKKYAALVHKRAFCLGIESGFALGFQISLIVFELIRLWINS